MPHAGKVILAVQLLIVVVLVGVPPPSAQAAFPGRNGKIAFRDPGNGAYGPDSTGSPPTGILTVAPRGRQFPTVLVPDGEDPSYSADGKMLTFSNSLSVFVVNADGSGLTQITTGQEGVTAPSFSPSGNQIVFGRQPGFSATSYIFMVNIDGTGLTQLTTGGAKTRDDHPRFSPNGKSIAFNSRNGIDIMRANGSGRRALIRSKGDDRDADFSPNGRQITFTSTRNKKHPGLYVAKANGRHLRQIFAGYGRDQCTNGCPESPVFSPDGKWIVYSFTGFYGSTLYPIRADSRSCSLPRCSYGPSDICCQRSGKDAITPSWQPLPRRGQRG